MVEEQICTDCRTSWPLDRYNASSGVCFRCRAHSVALTWGPRGKAGFHGETITEFQTKTVAAAKSNGLDVVPAWTKPNYGGGGGHLDKLGTILNKKESNAPA